jgi:hypothetical protein
MLLESRPALRPASFSFCSRPDVVLHHLVCHRGSFLLLLVQCLLEQKFALPRAAIFRLDLIRNVGFFASEDMVEFRDLFLEMDHLRELGTVLIQGVAQLRVQSVLLFEHVLNDGAVTNRGDRVEVSGLGQLEDGFLVDAISLRLGQLPVDVAQFLRSYILFFVDGPDLIRAFIVDTRVFGSLHFGFQLIELAGQPGRSLHRRLIPAAKVLLDEIRNVSIHDFGGEFGIATSERNIQQASVRYALDAQPA